MNDYGINKQIEHILTNDIIYNMTTLVNDMLAVNKEYPHSLNGFDKKEISNLYYHECFNCDEVAQVDEYCKECGTFNCKDIVTDREREVIGWYAVSEWFYVELREIKEVVLAANGLYFWGCQVCEQDVIRTVVMTGIK